MNTYISISMYPDSAFIHVTIENINGYKYSTCEQVSIEKAKEVAWEFNIKIN